MRKRIGAIHGPYPHGKRWRLVVHREGRPVAVSFDTRELADKAKREAIAAAQSRTVSDAIDEYIADQRARGLKKTSWPTTRARLRALLVPDGRDGGPIERLGPARARSLYKAMCARPTRRKRPPSPDTCKNVLAEGGTFTRWCVEQKWLRADPFVGVTDKRRRRRGKPQLRIDEARKLIDHALRAAERGDVAAVAVAAVFIFGTRSSELVERQVRDLDDEGAVLWVPDSKTDAGRRTLEVPELLQPHLIAAAKGRPALAPLFLNQNGRPASRHWVHYHVRRLCSIAGVAPVTPHGLRGTHATIAIVNGQSSKLVAEALGHTGPAVTHAHYVDGGAARAAGADRVMRVIRGGRR
jgi:site-specific recombinase XerD